jgi:threonine/homoserine/homoserine lactone efflux protein
MNNYQFGQFVYNHRGLGSALLAANGVANSYGIGAGISTGLGVATAAGTGLVLPALGVASTLYGLKQVYDGIKGFSKGF